MARRSNGESPSVANPALTVELTSLLLARVAPDELPVLDESAQEYFADPASAFPSARSDTPLGSGISVTMMTPYLISAAGVVLPILGTFVGDVGKDIVKDLVKDPVVTRIRALFKRRHDEPPGPVALSPQQAGHVRTAIVQHCHTLGLPSNQAALIADATIGSLHVRR